MLLMDFGSQGGEKLPACSANCFSMVTLGKGGNRGDTEGRVGALGYNKMRDERDIWEKGNREKGGLKGRSYRGGFGWGHRGKVVALGGGCALSEVAVWNHPGPCNS